MYDNTFVVTVTLKDEKVYARLTRMSGREIKLALGPSMESSWMDSDLAEAVQLILARYGYNVRIEEAD